MTRLKRPNRNDVATHANVSGWTVSQVLNAKSEYPITEEARRRVLAAAKELGYRPNPMARALVTGNTGLVSLWMRKMSPYYSLVAKHVQTQIRPSGLPLLITEIEQETKDVTEPSWAVDGIIAVEFPEYIQAFLASHPHLAVPFVSIGVGYSEAGDYVGIDPVPGVEAAMTHLLALGCKRILYLHENDPLPATEVRRHTYNAAMCAAGLSRDYLFAPSRADARQTIPAWIARHGRPDAVFCHNDDLALGVYRGLLDLGINVPNDVKMVGFDGIEETEYLDCPLTTVVQPVETMCSLAWEYLQRRIAEPHLPPQQTVLTPQLAIRASTIGKNDWRQR